MKKVDGLQKDGIHEDILQVKNWMTPSPFFVYTEQTYQEAATVMLDNEISCVPIVDQHLQPRGLITMKVLYDHLLAGGSMEICVSNMINHPFKCVEESGSLLEAQKFTEKYYVVVGEKGVLVGILTRQDVVDGLYKYIDKVKKERYTMESLNIILENAYEGVAVVDEHGIITEFNQEYENFTGIEKENAVGYHVTEVIENTRLHLTVKTGVPERGVLQNMQGQVMVVHRIPIWKNGKVVGAIGMLIFEGTAEIHKIFKKLQENSIDVENYSFPYGKKGQGQQESILTIGQIIGDSESISKVKRLARKSARTSATVLITGESGTGKEMFAKSIHEMSPFSTGPFISINCGAVPENLIESELFGYEEGAFTGARKGGKPGKFELANDGTLFLDEIGEMPLVMQAKLLRILQEKEGERLGGQEKYNINVRILAATNRNIEEMVKNKTFREDLYYRLNVIRLHIPPLRERKRDIPVLLSTFIKSVCTNYQVPEKLFTSEAVSVLRDYDWPGNIREVLNMIKRLATLIEGDVIELKDLPETMRSPLQSEHLITFEKLSENKQDIGLMEQVKKNEREQEKAIILEVLERVKGNKSKAAILLGIHRTTLYKKLKQYEIVLRKMV